MFWYLRLSFHFYDMAAVHYFQGFVNKAFSKDEEDAFEEDDEEDAEPEPDAKKYIARFKVTFFALAAWSLLSIFGEKIYGIESLFSIIMLVRYNENLDLQFLTL